MRRFNVLGLVAAAVGATQSPPLRFRRFHTKPVDLEKMAKAEIKRVRRAERNKAVAMKRLVAGRAGLNAFEVDNMAKDAGLL